MMKKRQSLAGRCAIQFAFIAWLGMPSLGHAEDRIACKMRGYREQEGLSARIVDSTVTIAWAGEGDERLRLQLNVKEGQPGIKDLSIQRGTGAWTSLLANVSPDISVVTGLRRISNQQLQPLRARNVPISKATLDKYRWEPFWDAPLDMSAPNPSGRFAGSQPPADGVPGADQPGLPRSPNEVQRAAAIYRTTSCTVSTDGARLMVSYPGVTLGLFSGQLNYTVFKGSNLIRQEVIAKTTVKWVAYKYDSGLKGVSISNDARVAWRDVSNAWQEYRFGGAPNTDKTPLRASNRIAVVELKHRGSIAVFPPPHKFFWAREANTNVGYNWYRKDSADTFGFGVRQNEQEEEDQFKGNWALYSARPGTDQRMTVFFYPGLGDAAETASAVLKFTHGDRYKPLPGYQVMSHHYHMDMGERLLAEKSVDVRLPDLEALRALGINIVSQVDSINLENPNASRSRPNQLLVTAAALEGARRSSDQNFLVMANQEILGSPLGGHTDLLFSHPVYWDVKKPGQAFEESSDRYDKIYHIGGAADLMRMAQRENILISMPHPRTKGSTGYPEAIKDESFFSDPHYNGIGVRWGMGLDGSERRLCDYRCWPLLDQMTNWVVDRPIPLKFILSISEAMHLRPGDDIYSSQPITYVRLAALPYATNPAPIIDALAKGDTFWTTGEVLLPAFSVQRVGLRPVVVADLEWTFPLDFVEVVWGDGRTVSRDIIRTTDLPSFGSKRFEITLPQRANIKWVRFAAWDIASNGVASQPVRVTH